MPIAIVSYTYGLLSSWKCVLSFFQDVSELIIYAGGLFSLAPRNPLPEGYHPPVLADKSTINRCLWLSTRETAGAGVDQMMIILPLQAYSFLQIEYLRILVYHGHIFGSQETEAQAQRIKLQFFL
jgi:hypothetical protein